MSRANVCICRCQLSRIDLKTAYRQRLCAYLASGEAPRSQNDQIQSRISNILVHACDSALHTSQLLCTEATDDLFGGRDGRFIRAPKKEGDVVCRLVQERVALGHDEDLQVGGQQLGRGGGQ